MKRTELKRKTPLHSRAGLRRTGAPARKPMARKAPRKKPSTDQRWRSPAYLAWVRSLPCCRCGGPGGDPHHVIGLGWGLSGAGLTAPDSYAMPACRACHRAIHESPELQRYQPDWLRHVISRGVREWGGDTKAALIRAWDFINERERA